MKQGAIIEMTENYPFGELREAPKKGEEPLVLKKLTAHDS
jgi:hypothetical protein